MTCLVSSRADDAPVLVSRELLRVGGVVLDRPGAERNRRILRSASEVERLAVPVVRRRASNVVDLAVVAGRSLLASEVAADGGDDARLLVVGAVASERELKHLGEVSRVRERELGNTLELVLSRALANHMSDVDGEGSALVDKALPGLRSIVLRRRALDEVLEGLAPIVADVGVGGDRESTRNANRATSRRLVQILRRAGAKEVHFRVSSPPVKFPCYLGIDTPSKSELISSTHELEEIRKEIGADSLAFISLKGMLKALGSNSFCRGCFSGEYPV